MMQSHVRRNPRPDFHPSLAEQREAEHNRQMRKLLKSLLPVVVAAIIFYLARTL